MLGGEPWVDAQQVAEAGEQQPRADEQYERERDLRDDERSAYCPRGAASRPRPAVFAQDDAQVHARDVHGRDQADDDAEREGQAEDERDDGRIHADFVRARNVGEPQRSQRAEAPVAKAETQQPAEDRQDSRFGDQLTDDAAPGRAERVTRGKFLQSATRSRQ